LKLIRVVIVCLLATAVISAPAGAQTSDLLFAFDHVFNPPEPDTLARMSTALFQPPAPEWHSMLTNIPGDWVRSGQRIFQVEAIPAIAGVALATGMLYAGDDELFSASHRMYNHSQAVHSATDVIIHAGDGKTTLGLAAVFAIYGFADSDNRALRTGSQLVEAMIGSGIVVQLLKRVTGRESPEMASHERGRWQPFTNWQKYNHNQPRYYAFPSGHVTTTMATVTVIAENYPEVGWIRPVGYSIVGLVGVSLVNVGWHWYSDFPLAIALGYTFGMIASHRDDPDPGIGDLAGMHGLKVMPSFGPEGTGVTIAYSF